VDEIQGDEKCSLGLAPARQVSVSDRSGMVEAAASGP
jgi:hypothetical protein